MTWSASCPSRAVWPLWCSHSKWPKRMWLCATRSTVAAVCMRPRRTPCGRHAKGMQCLAGQVFPDAGAQHGAAIAHAREGRRAGTLEVQLERAAIRRQAIAEQQAATITEIRIPATELVAAIFHRQRFDARPALCRRQHGKRFRALPPGTVVQAEAGQQACVEVDQAGMA